KSAQIREILISESAWEEMTCLFAPSLAVDNFYKNRLYVKWFIIIIDVRHWRWVLNEHSVELFHGND
ncbi:hypothetical protein POX30_12470, partial [Raoultella planticola]